MATDRQPDPRRERISLTRAIFSRRVLDRRITSGAILVGVILGAIVGECCGSFLAGVWIGLVLGIVAPGPIAYLVDRAGRLPAGALYKRLSLRDVRSTGARR